MKERISTLKARFDKELAAATSLNALEELRVAFLGKKGEVAELMKGLRDVADKKEAGALINTFKTEVESKITERAEELRAAAIAAKVRGAKKYNPTLVYERELGSYHPITLVQRECEKIFKIDNLYDINNTALVHHINLALKANYFMNLRLMHSLKQAGMKNRW